MARTKDEEALRCRDYRAKKAQAEASLSKEVDELSVYEDIVQYGPDLFSHHRVEPGAPFSFVSEGFNCLQLTEGAIIGKPLSSIVDPRHGELLAAALGQVITNDEDTTKVEGGDNPTTMVELRVTCGGVTFSASMSMRIEPHKGLVIVTRLYPVEDVHGI